MQIFQTHLDSPLGPLFIYSNENNVIHLAWSEDSNSTFIQKYQEQENDFHFERENDVLKQTRIQLDEYFRKERTRFELPLMPQGTPFQISVWEKLQEIPYGSTWSYEKLARSIGKERAVRAVGNANGKNPIPIIIPCHRVIEKNGNLGGYSGGLHIKDWLLSHEGYLLGTH
jgi:methylated-DNA-[protein]-cysteine S-methyltransferase